MSVTLTNTSFYVGKFLFQFIEKHFQDFIQEFLVQEGLFSYDVSLFCLTLKCKDSALVQWFENTVLSKVCLYEV